MQNKCAKQTNLTLFNSVLYCVKRRIDSVAAYYVYVLHAYYLFHFSGSGDRRGTASTLHSKYMSHLRIPSVRLLFVVLYKTIKIITPDISSRV